MPSDPNIDAAASALVRASFDSAPDALLVIDGAGRALAMNDSFIALWGVPAALRAGPDRAALDQHVMRQLRDPDAYTRGTRALVQRSDSGVLDELQLLDGRVFERHVSPLGGTAYPGAVVVRWRDVTPRTQAEQALALAQARLAAVFDHAREAILLADDQARYVDANPAACRLLGRTRDELLRLSVADVMGASADAFQAAWSGFLTEGTSSGEVPLRRPDGSVRVARFNAVARIQPGLHLSILTDITDETAGRARQQELATQMDLAMANAETVFWVADLRERRVSLADPRWLSRLLGYDPAELGDHPEALDRLVHPDDLAPRLAAWLAHVDGRTPAFECEFRLRHRDGRWLWVLARGRAVERDASGRALRVAGIRIDITRRKQAELELESRAFTDGLTGVLNRRRFIELAEVEVSRALRHRQPVALLMVDLDHFKSVNDRFGHAGGDAVLRAFAASAQAVMRSSDLLGRVGGEEFAALLPQTDQEGATALAQRLQALVRGQPAALPAGPATYTVSIGVAAHAGGSGTCTVEALMVAADTALYRAKDQGRDRVLVAPLQ